MTAEKEANKMMKLDNLTTRKSEQLEAMNVMTDAQIQEIIETRINGTYQNIVDLKADKEHVINLTDAKNVIRTLARLGYVAGSKVGIITNLVEVSGVLMDMDYNKQFLKENSNEVDMLKLSKVFKCLKTKEAYQVGYNEMFIEVGTNVFVAEYVDGRTITLVKATKADVQRFVDQLSSVSKLTQEDLVKIGRDLEKIGRVMQELEIDSAKNPTVKEGMLDITEFMNAYNCTLAAKKTTISHNFDEIVAIKKANGKLDTVEFEYAVDEYLSLDKVYEVSKAEYQEYLANNPQDTEEEKAKKKYSILMNNLKDSYIEDAAMELKMRMVHQQKHDLAQLVEMYKKSNMSLFDEFKAVNIKDAEEADIIELRDFAVKCCEMIHNHYKYKKHFPMTKIEDLTATLRNAIYSLGDSLGFKQEETFRIGCMAGWFKLSSYRGQDKVVVSPNYRFAAISGLFETELKWHFNADAMYSTLEVELPDNYAIAPGTPVYMEDGASEVLVDGETDFIICTEEDYTGMAVAKVIDGVPMFVKFENPYAYESIEFIMFDKICDIFAKENTFRATDSVEVKALATKLVEESNTYGKDEAEKNLLETKDAEKFKELFTKWANYVQLGVADKETKGLFVNKINNDLYISIRNRANGVSKMLGRLSTTGVKSLGIAEYNTMDTIVCAAGAIAILKK